MSDIRAWRQALATASVLWRDWGEELTGAARSLTDLDAGAAGDRVLPTLEAFLDQWSARLRAVSCAAEGNADALAAVWGPLEDGDRDAVTRLRALMPFGSPSPLPAVTRAPTAPGDVDLEQVWGGR